MVKKSVRMAFCLLLTGTVLTAFVAMAADVGSQSDPLVTLSYLNETFLGRIMEQVDEKLEQRDKVLLQEMEETVGQAEQALREELLGGDTTAAYHAVQLADGQVLRGDVGCEVILRTGSAMCVSEDKSTPGLLDMTDGISINDSMALKTNHLYMMTTQRGVKAAGAVTLLVRGIYTVE